MTPKKLTWFEWTELRRKFIAYMEKEGYYLNKDYSFRGPCDDCIIDNKIPHTTFKNWYNYLKKDN